MPATTRSLSLVATVRQLTASTFPYLVAWWLMVRTLGIPDWISLALAVPATGLLGWTFLSLRTPYPADPRP